MLHNFKALCLVGASLFALSLVLTADVRATPAHFTGGPYLTAIQDEQAETTVQQFNTEFGLVDCDMFEAEGQLINEGKPTITGTTAELANIKTFGTEKNTKGPEAPCEAFGLEAELDFNSCHYTFHVGGWNGKEATGSMDIGCTEKGDTIEIIAGGGLCEVSVPPQSGITNVLYTNEEGAGSESITVYLSSINIEYEGSGGLCTGEYSDGEYEGKVAIKGYADVGHKEQVPVKVQLTEDEEAAHFTGGGSYLTATQDNQAESYALVFTTPFLEVYCSMLEAEGQLINKEGEPTDTGDVATFTNVNYFGNEEGTSGSCGGFFGGGETDFNSCHYTFHAGVWVSKDAHGTLDIECEEEGDAVELDFGFCVISFPPQTDVNNITYTNETVVEDPESIVVDIASDNLKYELLGPFCSPGEYEGGELSGQATIQGYEDAAHKGRVPLTVGSSNT